MKMRAALVALFLVLIVCPAVADEPDKTSGTSGTEHVKLFLTSKGLVNDAINGAFLDFLPGEPHELMVAIIPNATSSARKRSDKFKREKKAFTALGFDDRKVVNFDIEKNDPKDLADYHIIYILGGNPFYLLEQVRQTGAGGVLIDLARKGHVLMGYSAGTLLLGPSLDQMNYVDEILGFNDSRMTNLECLGLYDFFVFPHYNEFIEEFPGLRKALLNFEHISEREIMRLSDHQAIAIDDDGLTLIEGQRDAKSK